MIITEQIFKYRLRLSKKSNSASAGELKRMLKQALLEGGLAYAQSKAGPRLALGPSAAEGESSLCQYADICLLKATPEQEINLKLSAFISGGYKIIEVKEVPYAICSVEAIAQYALYTITGVKADAQGFEKSDVLELDFTHENGIRENLNIKPFIFSIKQINEDKLELVIKLNAQRSFGLRQILSALPGLEVNEHKLFIERSALLWQSSEGNLQTL